MSPAGGAALVVAAAAAALCAVRAVRQGVWATTTTAALPFEVDGCRVHEVRARLGGVTDAATFELRPTGDGRVLGSTVVRGVSPGDTATILVLVPASGDGARFELVVRSAGNADAEWRREVRFGAGDRR